MPTERRYRWGVELRGDLADLEDWEEDLPPPFDPSVVVLPDKNNPSVHLRVLQSTSFDTCTSALEVRDIAIPLVRTLSGLIGVRRGAMPVAFGGLIQLMDDGSWSRYTLAEATHMMRPPKTRATVTVGGQSSSSTPAHPTPSYAQSMVLNLSDDLQAALRYYDMADNWYDLYKAYEAVLSHYYPVGNKEKHRKKGAEKMLVSLGFTPQELSDLSQSPQPHRHYTTPAQPVLTFQEAKALTRRIIEAAVQASCSP